MMLLISDDECLMWGLII